LPNEKQAEGDKPEVAEGIPEKDFFIDMITKDIPLDACILDLLDNAIDGASAELGTKKRGATAYKGYQASITLSGSRFLIEDNCGGFDIETAKQYAFHFGRNKKAPHTKGAIGTYGIGMKRAVFKIGKTIKVTSRTEREAWSVNIDVQEWSADPKVWDFPLIRLATNGKQGTTVEVTDLNPGVGREFGDEVFRNRLTKATSRSYALFLQKGFAVKVNDAKVTPFEFSLKSGQGFKPIHEGYKDDGIDVELWAGLGGVPPDDDTAGARIDVERYGWYVICNDRAVITGDKTQRTIWGDEDFTGWHPQYNGFLGILSFEADDAAKLPWTTTKKDMDVSNPIYRRAIQRMKAATTPFIKYTNQRKASLEAAKQFEETAVLRRITEIPKNTAMSVPKFAPKTRAGMVNILYQKSKSNVKKVAQRLGNPTMAARDVGSRTFDYFLKNEVGD
jgi:hypothetical protein